MSNDNKISKSLTLSPLAVESLEKIAHATRMDLSSIVDGCIQATWAAILSNGFRKFPSVPKALAVTGAAGSSFYIKGRKEDLGDGKCEE